MKFLLLLDDLVPSPVDIIRLVLRLYIRIHLYFGWLWWMISHPIRIWLSRIKRGDIIWINGIKYRINSVPDSTTLTINGEFMTITTSESHGYVSFTKL